VKNGKYKKEKKKIENSYKTKVSRLISELKTMRKKSSAQMKL